MTQMWTCRTCGQPITFAWRGDGSRFAEANWKARRTCAPDCTEADAPVAIGLLTRTATTEAA